jgi:16S rRNA (cytosine1402-N4)-methyltransferase
LKSNEETTENLHKSVLLAESLSYLSPKDNEIFVDATLGLGGHAEAILSASEKTQVIGIDQDTQAISRARNRLERFGERFRAFHANFSEIRKVLAQAHIEKTDGVLADLGVSSLQLDSETRGFSFRYDAPLDMRMDAESDEETAAEMLETLSEFEIARIIYEYGEERFSRKIARWIVERRERGESVKTTGELARLVERAVPRNKKDRIIKQTLQKLAGKCFCPPNFPKCVCGAEKKVEILTRKPVVSGEAESEENPRARSAKLRACLKL